MELISNILDLVMKVDKLFYEVVHSNKKVEEELNELVNQMVIYTDQLYLDGSMDREFALEAIDVFSKKVELIHSLLSLDVFKPESLSIDDLHDTMDKLEVRRYEIMDKYVKGTLSKEEIDIFEIDLKAFKKRVYSVIPENDEILYDIAKMKSKIQHLNTEILEDEEVLKVAYSNSN